MQISAKLYIYFITQPKQWTLETRTEKLTNI